MADRETPETDASDDGGHRDSDAACTADEPSSTSCDDTREDCSTASSGDRNGGEYQVGDIVWAKIGKYPYWPSIVCRDPDSNTFVKGSPEDKKNFSLHIRFYNDNGRRSWVKILHDYSSKDDLLSKYPNCLSFIKNSKKQMASWNMAIGEADGYLKFDKKERWIKFASVNNIKSSVTIPIKPVKLNSSSSVTTSNNLLDDANSTKTESITKKIPECYDYLEKSSNEDLQKEDLKKKKVFKKETGKDSKGNPLKFISFTCPEQNYHIDDNDEKPLIPTHPHRKVPKHIIRDVERLEAEGIRKVNQWKASKFAKATSVSVTPATQK